jgi:L-ascorbate metabolism protein UlaG (beta-lactamase superfamily)
MGTPIWFRWLGVAGIELNLRGQVLLIDPFFTRPPFWRMWFGRVRPDRELVAAEIPRCDHVLVTHAHWDHLMDVPDVARNTGATVLGSPHTCRLLAACGVPEDQIQEIRDGDEIALGILHIQVLSAEHQPVPGFAPAPLPPDIRPPLRLRDYRMDCCYSYLITVDGVGFLDWRSVRPERAPPADVLFVAPGGTRRYYKVLLCAVRPRVVIPMHWDDMFRPLSRPVRPFLEPARWAFPPLRRVSLSRFRSKIAQIAPEARVFVPETLRAYDLREYGIHI